MNDYPTTLKELKAMENVRRSKMDMPLLVRTTKWHKWRAIESWITESPWGRIGIAIGAIINQATGVTNLWDAAGCASHDELYKHHINFDGVVLTKIQADLAYRWVNERSAYRWNRFWAAARYRGVRILGVFSWTKPKPILPEMKHLYKATPFNEEAERKED